MKGEGGEMWCVEGGVRDKGKGVRDEDGEARGEGRGVRNED